jgi:predicted nucleic acid-binding Zn ribbon protein
MDNRSITQQGGIGYNSITKTVIDRIANTHCIVCGTAFGKARRAKLYCSHRCKQFGYNHKTEIQEILSIRNEGINKKPMVFFMDDYLSYSRSHKLLRQFKELKRKQLKWESVEQQMVLNKQYGIPSSEYLWSSFVKDRLSDDEDFRLADAEALLDERLLELTSKDLSIEQWSFMKSLYPGLDEIAFFEIVCSLSGEFIDQLSINETEEDEGQILVIKNKFRNHCNLIATGIIKFEKKTSDNAEE